MLRITSAASLQRILHPIAVLLRDLTPWLIRAALGWLLARLRGSTAGKPRQPCRSCPFLPAPTEPPTSPAPQSRPIVPPMLAIASLGALLAMVGCAPATSYIAAERGTLDVIAPEYAAYVRADASLDAAAKARRQRTLESWRIRLQQAESSTAR